MQNLKQDARILHDHRILRKFLVQHQLQRINCLDSVFLEDRNQCLMIRSLLPSCILSQFIVRKGSSYALYCFESVPTQLWVEDLTQNDSFWAFPAISSHYYRTIFYPKEYMGQRDKKYEIKK